MALEIERKFLVKKELWLTLQKPSPEYYRQGYLLSNENITIRIRLTDTSAFITVKGRTTGVSRPEYEYTIPQKDAREMLDDLAENSLEKYRYKMHHEGKLWEVDVFKGDSEGLVMAEIELKSETETFALPDWIGEEVTGDPRYYNSWLAANPFKSW